MLAEEIYFAELSKELAGQREARESLRTRAIAILSAGALVFALTRSPSGGHLDVWLLVSLVVLVVMGFCVALVLAPAPISTVVRYLDLDAIAASAESEPASDADRELYRGLIFRTQEGIASNHEWTNRRSLMYSTATVLLVVEIALIAAHFSGRISYRIAISAVTAVFLVTFAAWPLRSIVKVIHAQRSTVFPERMWAFLIRAPVVGTRIARRLVGDSELRLPLTSLRVPEPIPGEDLEAPQNAYEVERAIHSDGDVVAVLRRSRVFALGHPAGTIVGISGTESDLLHFTVDVDRGEVTMLPVFTDARFMLEPLRRNPDWGTMSVLEIEGDALVDNVDDDVSIVINPWSDTEFQIPPSARSSKQEHPAGSPRATAGGTAPSAVERRIMVALEGEKALSAAEVSAATGLPLDTVTHTLSKLTESGELVADPLTLP